MKKVTATVLFSIVALYAVCTHGALPHAIGDYQPDMSKILNVELPGWRLHFGVFSYPPLNPLQKARLKIESLQEQIAEHEKTIEAKREEIERITTASVCRKSRSYFLLGLYGHETEVRAGEVICDRKSLLWGTVRWGKQKP